MNALVWLNGRLNAIFFADELGDPGLALSQNSGGSRAANADGAPRKHAAFHSSQRKDGKAPPHVQTLRQGWGPRKSRGRTSAASRRNASERFRYFPPRSKMRAWGMPGARCTRSLACKMGREHTR